MVLLLWKCIFMRDLILRQVLEGFALIWLFDLKELKKLHSMDLNPIYISFFHCFRNARI